MKPIWWVIFFGAPALVIFFATAVILRDQPSPRLDTVNIVNRTLPSPLTPLSSVASVPAQTTGNWARPFSAMSHWNTPITGYTSVNHQPTQAFSGFLPAMSVWPVALGPTMWSATSSDPLINLYYHKDAWINVANGRWKRSGNSPAIEAEIRLGMDQRWEGYEANMYSSASATSYVLPSTFHHRTTDWSPQARVPANALPPKDVDGHMAVLQPNGWVLETLGSIRLSNGDLVTMFASYTDPNGLGHGDSNGRRASMVPNYAGILRSGELSSGRITHALAVGVGPEALQYAIAGPATAFDRSTVYSGSLAMGTLLAIPASVDLSTLQFQTPQGRTLARAAQEYGMYVTDVTGPRYFLILSEANVTDVPAWSGPLEQDLKIILRQLQSTMLGARR